MTDKPPDALDQATLARVLRPENSPGFLAWQVVNQWQRRVRTALEPMGITQAQFVLLAGLAWLARREPAVTQARLAAFCRTDVMMTSQIARSLEHAGLIARAPHAGDRRSRILAPTEAGIAVLNRAMPAMLAADRAYFGRLGDRADAFVGDLRHLAADGAAGPKGAGGG